MMKRSLAAAALLAFSLTREPGPACADFEDIGYGARPMGMGRAFVGLADDSRAIFYNPAGLAYLQRLELSGDYSRLFSGLGDNAAISSSQISFAVPMRRGMSRADRFRSLKLLDEQEKDKNSKIRFYSDMGTAGLAVTSFSLEGAMSENTVWLSYARKLKDRFAYGFNFKLLTQSFTLDDYTRTDPVFGRGSKNGVTAFGADVGALYNAAPRTFVGFAASNINKPDVALNSSDTDKLPMALKFGLAHKHKTLNADADLILQNGEYKTHMGGERWFWDKTCAVRFGGGFGSSDYRNITAGGSINWMSMQIDYAMIYPVSGVKEIFGSHRLSLVYRFGKRPAQEIEIGSIEYYYGKLRDEAEILRTRLEKSEDERSRLGKVLEAEAAFSIKEKVRLEKLQSDVDQIRSEIEKPPQKPQTQAPLKPLKPKEEKALSRPKVYTVEAGDTLNAVAEKVYGDARRWKEIFNANKEKIDRGRIEPGTVLNIP